MTRALLLLAALLALGGPAHAQAPEAPSTCPLAPDALPEPVPLAAARAAVQARARLSIMTIGGAVMTGSGMFAPEQTYPARTVAHLRRLLPGVEITLANRAVPNSSARGMARRLAADLAELRPDLVLWASGSREAVRHTDLGSYAETLEAGIAAIRAAGADALLLDTQFAPGWAAIPNLGAYRDVIRTVGELRGVPVFPRFALMEAWHESGVTDLAATDRAVQMRVAVTVFDCVGDGLARMVARSIR